LETGSADVIVVGGGVYGLSTAYFLAREKKSVILLERGASLGREGSGSNAANICFESLPSLVFLTFHAIQLWKRLTVELNYDIVYRDIGRIEVAETEEELAGLADGVAVAWRSVGIKAQILSPREARKREPSLTEHLKGASYIPMGGYVIPARVTYAFARAADRLGVCIRRLSKVTGLEPNAGLGIRVLCGDQRFEAPAVVVAAGPWSGDLTRMVGVDLPLGHRVLTVTVLDRAPMHMRTLVTHARSPLTAKQFPNGNVVIGGGWRAEGDLNSRMKRPTWRGITGNLRAVSRILPALRDCEVLRSWAGVEACTSDQLPVLGELISVPGLYVLSSGGKSGFTTGPMLGRIMADVILKREPPLPLGPMLSSDCTGLMQAPSPQ
jgi:sarcosine oxidase subunit beta